MSQELDNFQTFEFSYHSLQSKTNGIWLHKLKKKMQLKLKLVIFPYYYLKTKIMASGPITSWEIDGETVETVSDFIFWGSKTLQMVKLNTAAIKLKDAYSLEGKL